MHILYYSWGENTKVDMIECLSALGHTVSLITAPISNQLVHPELEKTIFQAVSDSHCDIIFSFNYLPVIAQAAEHAKTPYVSWVYDCPHWTLYSPTIASPYNHIFLFDLAMVDMTRANGAVHAYHLPLAVNTHRLHTLLEQPSDYNDTIAFVGSLYDNNLYRQIQYLPEQLRGYLDGLLAAQKQIWGQNLLEELLTPELAHELGTYLKCETNPLCPIPATKFFLSMLQTELTCEERIEYLTALAKIHPLSLYTTSSPDICPKASFKGAVHYTTQMPYIFANSQINLNISLRSITSGIPLRAMDIMGCGGFLLTNYQPELNQYFTNGTDYVYFDSLQDLLNKSTYYLEHPKERIEIAQNGLLRVASDFSYEHQITQMLSLL